MSTDVATPDERAEPQRAHGLPVMRARIRQTPADFQVSEELGFEPSGDGEHDFLWVEKTGANTAWVARRLAKIAGVQSRDVGYAGLKDRNAVTRQWFSVRRRNRDGTDWHRANIEGVEILDVARHARKLRRGAHQANRFRIALRGSDPDLDAGDLGLRVAKITAHGMPNYFGEQRFGRAGNNLQLAEAMFSGKRLGREARGHALSAARSRLFNAVLGCRVADGTWNGLIPGDLANLDGSRSVFPVDAVTAELQARCQEQDIHATATLWGDGAPLVSRDAAEIEHTVAARYPLLADGLCAARIDAASRPLRVRVRDLCVDIDDNAVWLEFRLPRGAYATTLLREIVDYDSRSST